MTMFDKLVEVPLLLSRCPHCGELYEEATHEQG